MTDTTGHIQFLGWQPTLGELIVNIIWPFVVPLLVALLFGPLRRWLSRTWNFCGDQISSISHNLRRVRIKTLEQRITRLTEYNDRQIMLRFFQVTITLVVLLVLVILMMIIAIRQDIIFRTREIMTYFNIPDTLHGPNEQTDLIFAPSVEITIVLIIIILTLGMSYGFASSALQEMADFADPPKAIKRLEERINALRAKSAPPGPLGS